MKRMLDLNEMGKKITIVVLLVYLIALPEPYIDICVTLKREKQILNEL